MIRTIRRILSESMSPAYGSASAAFRSKFQQYQEAIMKTGVVEYNYNDPNQYITLTQGKFNGAKAPKQLIIDLTTAAKKAGLDPFYLYGLCGQESTFGGGSGQSESRRGSKAGLISGWNLKEGYRPYDINRFLADNKVPGVITLKTIHGWDYSINDEAKANQYLDAHPNIVQTYLKKLNATPQVPPNFDDFYEAARWIKTKGVASYNGGDKSYPAAVNVSIQLLKRDKAFMAFVSNPVIPAQPQYKSGREPRRSR